MAKDGTPLGADELYRETWAWLHERGCSHLVSPRLIGAYAQNFARYIQCENAISHFGLLGKHPTTGGVVTSSFVPMSQSFQKQAKEADMPRNPKTPCSYPGCPRLTEGRFCEEHLKKYNQDYERYVRDKNAKRKYGRAWKRIRDRYITAHPMCEICLDG